MTGYAERLKNMEFCRQIEDIIEVGLRRYQEKYQIGRTKESPFVLYEKYSRRDVSLLMNCGKDLSSTMYGMKRIGDERVMEALEKKDCGQSALVDAVKARIGGFRDGCGKIV